MNELAVRSVARDRLLATGLVLLVIGAFVGILRFSDLDLAHWESVHFDAAETFPPGEVWESPFGYSWDTTQFDPFAGDGLDFNDLLLLVVFYGSTFVIGERILRTIGATVGWPKAVRTGAGFLVAYVPILVFVRLVTLRIDLELAPWLCLIAIGGTATRIVSLDRRSRSMSGPGQNDPRRSGLLTILGVIAVFVAVTVWTYQSGRNFLVSDSLIGFLSVIRDSALTHLPRFGKQSDEFLFNAVPTYALDASHTYALWYWLTNAFAKASMACLFFGAAFTLTRGRRLVGVLAACLVLFATPVADPRFYVSLFGGQNPTIFLGHAGRFLGIVLPIFVACVLVQRGRWALLGAAVLAMAVGASSVHLFVFTLFTAGFAIALALSDHPLLRPHLARLEAPFAARLSLLAILSPLLAYAYIGEPESGGLRGMPLVAGCAAAVLAAAMLTARSRPDQLGTPLFPRARAGQLVGLSAGLVVGAVAAGGSTSIGSLERLGPIGDALRWLLPVLDEPQLYEDAISADIDLFSATDCIHGVAVHCRHFEGFVGYYGTTVLLALLLWATLQRSSAGKRLRQRDSVLLLFAVAALNVGFFLTDFVGPTGTTVYWSLTRFIEVGYYLLLALSPVVLSNHLTGRVRTAGLSMLAVWVAIPFVSHPFARQWVSNLGDLLANVV
jgi:hypothetical protein